MGQEKGYLLIAIMAGFPVLVRAFGKQLTVFFNTKEQEDKTKSSIILQPFFYWLAGVFIVIGALTMLASLMLFPAADNANRELSGILFILFLFGGMCILGISFIFLRLNWRIEIREDGFSFRNVFRVTKQYSFEEITEVDTGRAYRYYKGKKKILAISMLQPNCFLLSEALSEWKKQKRVASNE